MSVHATDQRGVHTAPPTMTGILRTSARCGGCTEPVALNAAAKAVRLADAGVGDRRPCDVEVTPNQVSLGWDCPGCGERNLTTYSRL